MFGDVQTAAKLMVKVGADVEEAQRKLNGMSKDFDALKSAGTKMAIGITAAVAGVTAATVAFANKAIAAGSDLEESQNKVDVVFGESAAAMEQWAKTSNMAMGMTKQAALDNAGALGNLFSQLGAGQAKAAEMSRGLVSLSADLASFHNATGGATEVLDAISASFRGEYDAMQRYIPTLNAAAVEHQALAMTGKATADSLTAMDKALATQAIMLRDAGAALGDFSRTSDGWANLNRILHATLADLTTEIGTRLLPVITPFLQQLVDFVQNVGPSVVTTIGQIVTSFQSMVTAIGQVDLSVVTAQFEGLKQSIGIDFWAQVFGFIGQQIALTVTNFQELGFELSSVGEQVKAFGEFLKGDTSWSEYRARVEELLAASEATRAEFQKTYDEINGRDWSETIAALDAVSEANAQATDWWQRHGEALRAVDEASQETTDWWIQLADNIDAVTQTSIANVDALNKLAEANDGVTDWWQRHNEALSVVIETNQEATDWWQRHGEVLRTFDENLRTVVEDTTAASDALSFMADIWAQAYDAIQDTTVNAMDASRNKVLETFNGMAQDYAQHAQTIVDLEDRKGQMVAYLESVYQQQAAALQAAGQAAQLADLTRAHNAKLQAVLASYNTQIKLEKTGQTALLSNAKTYYLTTLSMMAKALIAQVAVVKANMMAMVRMIVSGYGSAAAAALAFNKIKEGMSDIGAINAAMNEVMSAFNAIEGAGIGAITEASQAFQDWQADIGGVADGLDDVNSTLGSVGSNAGAAAGHMIDPLEAAAKVVESLANMVQRAIDAFNKLAEWGGPEEGWIAKFDALVSAIRYVVVKIAQVAGALIKEAVDKAAEFAKSAVTIVGLLNAGVAAFKALDSVDTDVAGIRDKVDAIVSFVRYVVVKFAQVAGALIKEAVDKAGEFSKTAVTIVSLITAGVSAFEALDAADTAVDGIRDKVDAIVSFVRYVVVKFAQVAGDLNKSAVDKAAEFANGAGAVMKLISDAVGSLMKLKDYDADFNIFEAGIEQLVASIESVTLLIARLAVQFSQSVLDDVAQFSSGAGAVMKLIGDSVGSLMKLKDYDAAFNIWEAGIEQLIASVDLIVVMVARLSETFDEDVLAQIKVFTEGAGAVIKLIGDAVGNLMKLKDYDKDFDLANAGAQKLIDQIGAFVRKLIKLSGTFDADLVAEARKFADAVGPIIKLIGDAIGSLMKFKDYDKNFSLANAGAQKLIDQIGAFVRKLIKLSGTFDADLVAEAKKFADAVGPIIKLIGDAIESLMKFKEYDKNFSLANAGAQKLIDQIGAFVRKLIRLSGAFDADLLAAAREFADTAGPVVALIGDAIESLMKFKEYDKNFSLANAGAEKLTQQIGAFVRKLARLGQQIGQPALDAAKAFADAAGPVVDLVGDAITTFMKFKEYDKNFSLANAGAEQLTQQIGAFVRKLARLGQEIGQPALAAASQFAEAAADVVSTISDALDLLTKIKTYVSPSGNALLAFERDVEDMLLRFVRWVVFVIQPIAADLESDAMQAMEDMVNALRAALELLNGLVDYVAPSAAALTAFMDGVQQLAEDFAEWAHTNGPQLFKEIPPEFLAAFQDVFEGLRAAVDVLTALVDFVAPSVMAVMLFEEGYQRLFMDWLTWVQNNFSQTKNELLIAIAAVFSQVMEGLRTAVDVLTGLAGFVAPSAYAVMTFEEGYQRLFRDWVTWVTGTFADLDTELVKAVSSVFGDVFNGIGAAVDVLTKLTDYVSPSATAISNFEQDYQRLFSGFVTWAETTFTDIINTELLVAVAGAMSDLFTGLGAAVDVLTSIAGYISPTESAIASFETDYQRIAEDFALWAETAWTPEMAATTTAVGNAINALFTGLGTAVNVLGQIRNYTPPSQAVVDQFISDMTGVIGTMLAWVQTSFDEDAQEVMTSFGQTLQTLFTGIGTALTVLEGIANYTVPESQFILALQRFNANLLTAITSWITWLSTVFTPEATAFLLQFHTIMSTIVADMNSALQLLIDIEQAPLPTLEDLEHFLELVAALFDGVIYAMGDHSAGQFLTGLLAGMNNVQTTNSLLNAMRNLAEQLEEELRLAWGLGSPSRVAMGIGEMFVQGLAIGLRDLAGIPAMIQNELTLGGVALGADVRFSPAPRHDYLTVEFQGAYQAGMSPAEEKRITSAMVGELRRQGLALQVARV